MEIERLSHIGICVCDLERSRRFYQEALGFEGEGELRVSGEPGDTLLSLAGTELHALYLKRDGTRIELLHFEAPKAAPGAPPRAMNQPGLTHLSFRVRDVGACLARALSCGGQPIEGSKVRAGNGDLHAAFLMDPDGTRIELFRGSGDPDAPPQAG